MPQLDFAALTAEVARLETVSAAVVAFVANASGNAHDQATITDLTARAKNANDAITAAIPPAV